MKKVTSDHGCALHKGAFHDAICLRHNWHPPHLPSHCVCGSSFKTDHAPTCPIGGISSVRHNKLRDFTANLLTEVCPNVCIEPCTVASLDNCYHMALQIQKTVLVSMSVHKVIGVVITSGCFLMYVFFDVRVFHPNAPSYHKMQLPCISIPSS